MSSSGTSKAFTISNEKLKERKFHKIADFTLESNEPSPPVINNGGSVSVAITKWTTPYPEISFEKISYPKWEGIGQYIGQITNQPDFIKDYHFISLMRNIDWYNKPTYQGKITCTANTPQPVKATNTGK